MIGPHATVEVKRIPLSAIRITEYQARSPERVLHYVELMRRHPDSSPGFLSVGDCGDGTYFLQDGHHRFCAHILTGRSEALCVVIGE